jgi:hypothetical protein
MTKNLPSKDVRRFPVRKRPREHLRQTKRGVIRINKGVRGAVQARNRARIVPKMKKRVEKPRFIPPRITPRETIKVKNAPYDDIIIKNKADLFKPGFIFDNAGLIVDRNQDHMYGKLMIDLKIIEKKYRSGEISYSEAVKYVEEVLENYHDEIDSDLYMPLAEVTYFEAEGRRKHGSIGFYKVDDNIDTDHIDIIRIQGQGYWAYTDLALPEGSKYRQILSFKKYYGREATDLAAEFADRLRENEIPFAVVIEYTTNVLVQYGDFLVEKKYEKLAKKLYKELLKNE